MDGWIFITLYRRQWSKPSPGKRNSKGKMVVWRGLTNSWEKKWKAKEKKRYTHLNADFQRIARRHKKAFLCEQCKEIEENTRMGKTRDFFKKIKDTKGTFHVKKWKWKSLSRVRLCDPMGCSPWNSLGQNTGVGSLSLLQAIFPTQRTETAWT